MDGLRSLVDGGAGASWLLVGVLALATLESLRDGDFVWTAFLAATAVVLLLPAVAFRDHAVMLPPEVTALAVLPGVTRAVGPAWATDYALYLGVAAVALSVVVELVLFTDAEMSPWLADVLVVLTTMAAIGVWAVVQFYADRYLGTDLLGSKNAVNWEFVRATVAGVAAAVVFEFYFEYETHSDATLADLSEGDSG